MANNLAHCMTNKLEADFRAVARQLYDLQVAYIFKVPEEMQQTPCDFFGFTTNGIAILIECKQVNRNALPIGVSNGLAPHQWIHLRQAHRCGTHAFLIWRRAEETAVLPFSVCLELTEGRKSIAWSDAKRYVCNSLQTALIEQLS
jgi:penicillin-binding protein-related factor A (putative recombinase)